ncbi:efflux RND transporter permease subunit [Cupriavidus sp. CV2]|uniref:efflux RND transporter permease subunit n=1 Tax=Cupriavidus ulmosensis TaxID=3065913 RepID=UPI00296B11AE|nr:efflux RND transporter permease subunit [Cupriavidus sp. CV2]MDW3683288.1 efflux RND transporter permease subunit [Cupriavidus sp. CV2]
MKQGLSSWAIRRPIPTLVLFCVLTLAGIAAFLRLPVNANPPVSFPLVNVAVIQPGAAPAEIEAEITRRVENALAGLPGVRHVQSTVKAAVSDTIVEFQLGTDVDRATNDVRAAVGQIRGNLPQSILEPVIRRVDVEGGAMLRYVVASSTRTPLDLSWFIDDSVSRELLAVPGVQQVARFGGAERELRIEAAPAMLARYGLSIEALNSQLRNLHTEPPGGHLDSGNQRQAVRVPGRQASLDALRVLPIALPGGKWLPLGELARISDAERETAGLAQYNGEAAVGFSVWRGKGHSDTRVADRVSARLDTLHAEHPDIRIEEVASTVDYTRASYRTAMQTLIEGALLTVLVVFLFLRDWRATLIAAVALPLSILPVFLAMLWLDFTLNSITLLALTLVIGILVDDAIVEIENIDRHIHMGERPYQAALHAADAIALAVLATTLTIVAVFAPVGFIQGVVGQYFHQFGLTASIAVLASLLVARLLTPLMAAYFLRPAAGGAPSPHGAAAPQGRLMRGYLALLERALSHRKTTLLAMGGALVLAVMLLPLLPTGFLPVSDASLSQLRIELVPTTTPEAARQTARAVADRLRRHDAVAHVLVTADSPDEMLASITLKPGSERKLSRKTFELDVQAALAAMPDMRFQFLGDGGGREVSIMLAGRDPRALAEAAHQLAAQMRELPQLTNVHPSLAPPRTELLVKPRAADAARLGVSTEAIGNTLRVATTGEIDAQSARYHLADRQVPMRVRLADIERADLDVLGALPITTIGQDTTVPLAAVADIGFGEGDTRIERHDRQRRITVDANLVTGSLGQALDAIQALPAMQALPGGVRHVNYGESEYMGEMFASFSVAVAAGILAMFAILVLLFRDFLQPLTILVTLPLSLIGAIPALWLIGAALDLPAIIGILMLMGIVTKNAILLVDFTLNGMHGGLGRHAALMAAGATRARPIVMTTVAMVGGMIPAAIGFGADAGFRIPMAVTVIGGLIVSTALSLICVPVVFSYLDQLRGWLGPRLARMTTVSEEDRLA